MTATAAIERIFTGSGQQQGARRGGTWSTTAGKTHSALILNIEALGLKEHME